METSYEYYTDSTWALVSSDEKKVINRITNLAKEYPEYVKIDSSPESNHGVIVARIPRAWIKLPSPPTKRNFTEEQRKAIAERFKNANTNGKNQPKIDENESDE